MNSAPEGEWSEFDAWVNKINAERLALPPEQQFEFLKLSVATADPRWKSAATTLFFSTSEVVNREEKHFDRKREMRYFALSIAMLVVCVALAVFAPNLDRNGVYVLQLLAGLSAAGLLAYMPGMLEIDLRLKKQGSLWGGKVRGTSAGAAFLIVWFILPSLISHK